MSVRIERLSVRDFGPLRDLLLEPGDVTVVHGDNEAGKTSCIDALGRALRERVRPGNRKLLDHLRDGPGFEGEVDLVLSPEDGGPLVELLREHPSLARLFVVRDGDAALEAGRGWLNSIRGRLIGIDLGRVADRVRAAASLTPSGALRESRADERQRLAERLARVEAFLVDLPSLDRLVEEISHTERRRVAARSRVERLRAAERHERYRVAREALAAERAAQGALGDLERYGEEDLAAWREAIAAVRETAALAKAAEEDTHRLRGRLETDGEELRRKEAALEQVSAVAAECTRRDLPGLVATARLSRRGARLWTLWRTPLAVGGSLLVVLAVGLAVQATSAGAAGLGLPLGLAAGASAALGILACGLSIFATSRLRAAAELEERAFAGAGALLLSATTLEDCAEQVAGIGSRAERGESERWAAAERRRATEAALEAAELTERERARKLEDAQHLVADVRDRVRLASIDQLDAKLRARAQAESTVKQARQTLASLVGESTDYGSAIERLAVPDPGVAPDPAELTLVERELEQADERLVRLRAEVAERRDRALAAIGLPDLGAADAEREHLAAAVEAIDREAAAAKLCLQALRELALDIDRPLREALGAGPGAAGGYLSRLTGGRYRAVVLDGSGRLAVERSDGMRFPDESLSRGARDQLALAVRLALVRRLVGEPAFLVLDDALLSSDPGRREALAASIADLAGEGWQILYFTFDPGLRDRFAALGARVVEL